MIFVVDESPAGGVWRNIVKSPFLWLISVSYLVVYMVRTAALDWAQLYLIQDKNQSQYISNISLFLIHILCEQYGNILTPDIKSELVCNKKV